MTDKSYAIGIDVGGTNTVYRLNVTFHNFIGSTDPDTPEKLANLTVNGIVEDWAGPVIQNYTW